MVKQWAELTRQLNEHMKGGEGTVEVIRVLDAGEYESPNKLIARLILRPGCSLGYHTHQGEEEIIHVLRGQATYRDGDAVTQLQAGDSCVCLSGCGHSIACCGEEPLEIFAVICPVG